MEKGNLLMIPCAIFVFTVMMGEVQCEKPKKLFVFGDSYVDTGNMGRHFNHGLNVSRTWRVPYGMTFPKRPTGRFSDGRVFSDFMARFLGIKSPIPYKYRRLGHKLLPYGMNFAHGGAGVFETSNHEANLSVQIDQFQEQVDEGVFTKTDLQSSLALISISGNDYSTYMDTHEQPDVVAFGVLVVNKLLSDAKRVHDMGVKKVAVMGVPPLGCTPYAAYPGTQCFVADNIPCLDHNSILTKGLRELNNDLKEPAFFYINIYDAFMTIINGGRASGKFNEPLKQCCAVIDNDNDNCGDVDKNGTKRYTVCDDPSSMFFWDAVHPTQAGWAAVVETLLPYLKKVL